VKETLMIYPFRLVMVCQFLLAGLLLPFMATAASAPGAHKVEPEEGPHHGRMLRENDFAVELAIVETGVPPEFRAWVTNKGQPVPPTEVDVRVQLTRLGNLVDDIAFKAEGDYLRGNRVIDEPHSFIVSLTTVYQGKTHRWEYDNLEGRTHIADKIADAMGITTEIASGTTLHRTVRVYGKLVLPPDAKRQIQARFDGMIKALHVSLGDPVRKGQTLITIESNESLKTYPVLAPMDGIISQQFASSGEQAAGRTLLEITRTTTLLAELAVYPTDRQKIKIDAPVTLFLNGFDEPVTSTISGSRVALRNDQAQLLLAPIANSDGRLSEGLFVTGDIEVATIPVPLAVKRSGLQTFRDFTVVYAKVGEEYEVRMLELGREARPWVEVLGGLRPGTEYVVENSFIIKADIEKSGASHDH
jgi:cobalt-zinc-cadmium efflux system membrane fusion protein